MTVLAVLVGAACGVLSGFGIGGGSLLMIFLTAFQNTEQTTAQAINLLFFLPTAVASLFFHIRGKQVAWQAAIPAALSGVVTAALGAWIAAVLEPGLLRKLFGGFLLLVGIAELRKKPSPPPEGQVTLQNQ